MPTATPEHPERPQSVYDILVQPTNEFVVFDRVQMKKSEAEYRHHYTDATLALAQVCMEVGAQTIRAIENEKDDGTILFPGYAGGFSRLPEKDQDLVRTSYGAVIMGASIITMREAFDTNSSAFNRELFCFTYNEALRVTATKKITPKDLSAQDRAVDVSDREVINSTPWKTLTASYDHVHTIDFRNSKVWNALPLSLTSFINKSAVSHVIQHELSPAFVRQIAQIRVQEIPPMFKGNALDGINFNF